MGSPVRTHWNLHCQFEAAYSAWNAKILVIFVGCIRVRKFWHSNMTVSSQSTITEKKTETSDCKTIKVVKKLQEKVDTHLLCTEKTKQ